MRPLKAEFQAFGPYAGYESVDFEELYGRGLFLICGKTGIGKTMILDAMTFALFGKSSGHSRDDLEGLRCTNADFSTATFVKFEFDNNGEHYLFERRLERKRKNLSAYCNVSRMGDDGVFYPLMENPKEKAVNEKAAEIIGLDYEQFRRVYVLPQGQFERFLTASSEEKEKILTSIFGEEKWQMIAEHFYNEADKRKNALKDLQERISNSLTDEGCTSLSALSYLIENNREQERIIDEEYGKADYGKIIEAEQKKLSFAKRFEDLHKAEKRLSDLKDRKEERERLGKRADDGKRADRVRMLLDAEKSAGEIAEKRQEEKKEALGKKKESEEVLRHASEKLKLHAGKAHDTEVLRERKITYEGKRKDYEGLEEAEKELADKNKELELALKEENRAKKNMESSAARVTELKDEFIALQREHDELLKAYLSGITGELAESLQEGKPCPVCGSTEHPAKARISKNSITRAMVDDRREAAGKKYSELEELMSEQERRKILFDEKHAGVEKARTEAAGLSAKLDSKKGNLVPGISSLKELNLAIDDISSEISEYEEELKRLTEAEKDAKESLAAAEAAVTAAGKEEREAAEKLDRAAKEAVRGLKENGFVSGDEARALMLSPGELDELFSEMAEYDADLKNSDEVLKAIRSELKGTEEPDAEKSRKKLKEADDAGKEYYAKKAVLSKETERLERKLADLSSLGNGIEDRIREAEEDFAFAKKLRGDSGTGLGRYVLGIMFSSVVTAANKMLEMVHGGRYRLFRSDDRAQGSNKRGLELKVYDKNSGGHEGRFVSTLSGGEKFLASLALSIGMSTVAQKSGLKIEALFIDEGFGSLDDDSIGDAMSILNSIQEANGLVGIISHVQILQDQIPVKLKVEADEKGSHIIKTVG